jgi:hypothetical protein
MRKHRRLTLLSRKIRHGMKFFIYQARLKRA